MSPSKAALIPCVLFAVGGCDDSSESQDPDVITMTHRVDGEVVRRRTYRVIELEDGAVVAANAAASAKVLIGEREERLDGVPAAQPTLTAAALRAFMQDEWDPLVGGKDDVGVDARKFHELLTATRLTPARFVVAYRASGAPLADFVAFLEKTKVLRDTHGVFAVRHLLDTFAQGGLTLAELTAALARRGKTHDDFVAETLARPRGVVEMHEAWVRSKLPLADFLAAPPTLAAPQESGPGDYVDLGAVAVLQLAFDLIKGDADVTGNTTPNFVLNAQDPNPLNYAAAKSFTGPEFDDVVEGGAWGVDVRIHANVMGTFGATHPTLGGAYLPSLFVKFGKIETDSGASVNATATLSQADVTYSGTADNLIPTAKLRMVYQAHQTAWGTVEWTDSQTVTGDQGPTDHSKLDPDNSF